MATGTGEASGPAHPCVDPAIRWAAAPHREQPLLNTACAQTLHGNQPAPLEGKLRHGGSIELRAAQSLKRDVTWDGMALKTAFGQISAALFSYIIYSILCKKKGFFFIFF